MLSREFIDRLWRAIPPGQSRSDYIRQALEAFMAQGNRQEEK